jgi:hypothetical protein
MKKMRDEMVADVHENLLSDGFVKIGRINATLYLGA